MSKFPPEILRKEKAGTSAETILSTDMGFAQRLRDSPETRLEAAESSQRASTAAAAAAAASASSSASHSAPPPTYSDPFSVSDDERRMIKGDFYELGPVDGKLSGEQVKGVLVKSGLANDLLKKIWVMSDIDRDAKLDLDEFVIAVTLAKVRRFFFFRFFFRKTVDSFLAHLFRAGRSRWCSTSGPVAGIAYARLKDGHTILGGEAERRYLFSSFCFFFFVLVLQCVCFFLLFLLFLFPPDFCFSCRSLYSFVLRVERKETSTRSSLNEKKRNKLNKPTQKRRLLAIICLQIRWPRAAAAGWRSKRSSCRTNCSMRACVMR